MKPMSSYIKRLSVIPFTGLTAILYLIVGLPSVGYSAEPSDWSKIPVTNLTMFYPGQSSLEWLLSEKHQSKDKKEKGFKAISKGDDCFFCHEDDEAEMGENIVKGGPLEPMPVIGKPGSVNLALQVAYDNDKAYFRAQWKTRNPYPGEAHPFKRFDGKEWKGLGHPKLDKVVQDGNVS